jgi:site-specific recombinase XerD
MATGAISYMEPSEVQKFAGAYQEQQLFEEAEARALQHIERLHTYAAQNPDPTKLNPKDLVDAIPHVRNVIADLSTMQDLGRGTLETYTEALKR